MVCYRFHKISEFLGILEIIFLIFYNCLYMSWMTNRRIFSAYPESFFMQAGSEKKT